MKVALSDGAYMPQRAHFDDAGIDMRTPIGFILHAHEQKVVDLGVHVQIPVGYFGKMESKSGLLVNHGIMCMGGVVDSGFRGSIKVRMWNTTSEPYEFYKGDKLVQMVLIPTLCADIEDSEYLDPSASGRDNSGWGSTGR